MFSPQTGYRGNQNIKKSGEQIAWSPDMLDEYLKCKNDPVYFCNNYIKIVHVDHGLINLILRPFQVDLVKSMAYNKYTLACCSRQSGKTTAYVGFCLWFILFHEQKAIGLMANKGETARSILGRIQLAFENLPNWLQHGVVEYNKGKFVLENGSKIVASSTSSSTARGESYAIVILDETAFIERWTEFYASVYPTITSGQDSKLILVSTPNGLNFFHKFYSDAKEGLNNYNVIENTWRDVPGRDEQWKLDTIKALNGDKEKFAQEFEVEFIGSAGTLIAGWKLKELAHVHPIMENDGFSQYEMPIEEHIYSCIVDVSRGKGLDYSIIQVIDCTSMPYKQVAVYRSNMVVPMDLIGVVNSVGKLYNNAFVLIEINDIGGQIADMLHYEYEYDNILGTQSAGRAGKRLSSGFGGSKSELGIRTTKTVKNSGCSLLKMLIEGNHLIINDFETIHELSTFIRTGTSYAAQDGMHDDLAMGLVLFSWLSDQTYFSEITDINTLTHLRELSDEELMHDLVPFGFIEDGLNEEDEFIIEGGEVWYAASDSWNSSYNTF